MSLGTAQDFEHRVVALTAMILAPTSAGEGRSRNASLRRHRRGSAAAYWMARRMFASSERSRLYQRPWFGPQSSVSASSASARK